MSLTNKQVTEEAYDEVMLFNVRCIKSKWVTASCFEVLEHETTPMHTYMLYESLKFGRFIRTSRLVSI